jgi:hypothetical protein
MAKETDDRLDELDKLLALEKTKARRKMNEDLVSKEQETKDLRIKNKKAQIKIDSTSQDQQYNQDVEDFQGMVIDLIGDLNDLLLLAYKGRIGRTNINSLTQFQNKVIGYKKDLNSKLVVLKPNDRQTFLYTNKKIDSVMKNVVIPTISKDESKKERLKNKL